MPSKITLKSFMTPTPGDTKRRGRAMTSSERTKQRKEQRIRAQQRSMSAAKAEIKQVIKESLRNETAQAAIKEPTTVQKAKETAQAAIIKTEAPEDIKEPVTVQKAEVIVKETLKDVQQKNDEINVPETNGLFTLRVFQLKQLAFMYPDDYRFHVSRIFTQPSTFSSRIVNLHNAMALKRQKEERIMFVQLMQEEADRAIDRNFLECVHALERLIM